MAKVGPLTGRAHLRFALALHRGLSHHPLASVCWSPLSVSSALGMVAEGARGRTRAELLDLLLGDPDGDPTDTAALLAAAAHQPDDAVLAVSNTMWVAEGVPVVAGFAAELVRWPGGTVRSAPFATDPEHGRRLINSDVADTTHGLIPELLPAGILGQDTAATLVNALYLRTGWVNRFAAGQTSPRPFHTPDGTLAVPTMRLSASVGYAAHSGWQAVTLPASGGVQAVVLLPDGDLPAAESALSADDLAGLLDASRETSVELAMPKLRVGFRSRLDDPLRELGVRTLFTENADLSGVVPSADLGVSAVVHESVLRLDEEGMEGAAATATVIRFLSFAEPDQPVEVTVDRPFLLLIRHSGSGAIYFLARVVAP